MVTVVDLYLHNRCMYVIDVWGRNLLWTILWKNELRKILGHGEVQKKIVEQTETL